MNDRKFGYADKTGTVVIKAQFDRADDLSAVYRVCNSVGCPGILVREKSALSPLYGTVRWAISTRVGNLSGSQQSNELDSELEPPHLLATAISMKRLLNEIESA